MQKALTLAALLLLAGCQRDPGRDVEAMPDPLKGAAAPTPSSSDIIPIDKVSKSQAAAVSQRIANTEITLTYSRPVARGRQLFGALVPYGQIWTPGADQATAITFSRDVRINDQPLARGAYSIWTIPRADMWTVIFNRNAKAYHDHYPGEAQDAMRLDVRPEPGPHVETLTFSFPTVEGKDAVLRFEWGEVRVPLSIHVP